ncbi:hypothetical protein BKA69DRAFT_1039641 [Paraphysoderma sedebokerense]|nr:hypothetical protein BKA69DRAFT_1039641 [Paraphysoderma sedebokerense]
MSQSPQGSSASLASSAANAIAAPSFSAVKFTSIRLGSYSYENTNYPFNLYVSLALPHSPSSSSSNAENVSPSSKQFRQSPPAKPMLYYCLRDISVLFLNASPTYLSERHFPPSQLPSLDTLIKTSSDEVLINSMCLAEMARKWRRPQLETLCWMTKAQILQGEAEELLQGVTLLEPSKSLMEQEVELSISHVYKAVGKDYEKAVSPTSSNGAEKHTSNSLDGLENVVSLPPGIHGPNGAVKRRRSSVESLLAQNSGQMAMDGPSPGLPPGPLPTPNPLHAPTPLPSPHIPNMLSFGVDGRSAKRRRSSAGVSSEQYKEILKIREQQQAIIEARQQGPNKEQRKNDGQAELSNKTDGSRASSETSNSSKKGKTTQDKNHRNLTITTSAYHPPQNVKSAKASATLPKGKGGNRINPTGPEASTYRGPNSPLPLVSPRHPPNMGYSTAPAPGSVVSVTSGPPSESSKVPYTPYAAPPSYPPLPTPTSYLRNADPHTSVNQQQHRSPVEAPQGTGYNLPPKSTIMESVSQLYELLSQFPALSELLNGLSHFDNIGTLFKRLDKIEKLDRVMTEWAGPFSRDVKSVLVDIEKRVGKLEEMVHGMAKERGYQDNGFVRKVDGLEREMHSIRSQTQSLNQNLPSPHSYSSQPSGYYPSPNPSDLHHPPPSILNQRRASMPLLFQTHPHIWNSQSRSPHSSNFHPSSHPSSMPQSYPHDQQPHSPRSPLPPMASQIPGSPSSYYHAHNQRGNPNNPPPPASAPGPENGLNALASAVSVMEKERELQKTGNPPALTRMRARSRSNSLGQGRSK